MKSLCQFIAILLIAVLLTWWLKQGNNQVFPPHGIGEDYSDTLKMEKNEH